MPKKLKEESQEQQGERFQKEAQKLIDAGDFDQKAADAALDALVKRQGRKT